jgi:hypothetical protein
MLNRGAGEQEYPAANGNREFAKLSSGDGKGYPRRDACLFPLASGVRENTRTTVTVREELFFESAPFLWHGVYDGSKRETVNGAVFFRGFIKEF